MIAWREKQTGIIAPDERLPWPATIALGLQHVLAMFGATVVAPWLMGFDPNLAILFSGIGTLVFFALVGGRVPSYLGSSFAFIAPITAATASGGPSVAVGGILAVGLWLFVLHLVVICGWLATQSLDELLERRSAGR